MAFYTNAFIRNGKVYLRGYNDDNEPLLDIIKDYRPYLFFLGNGPYKTITGKSCVKKEFDSLYDAYNFKKQYEAAENAEFYGMTQFVYPFLNDRYPGEINFNEKLISVVSLDIEVDSTEGFPNIEAANREITAITIVKSTKSHTNRSLTFGIKQFFPKQSHCQYVEYFNEKDMLQGFLAAWNSSDWSPDIVTGWGIDHFDIPYLFNRIKNVLGETYAKKLSPFGFVEAHDIIRPKGSNYKNFNDRKELVYELYGITVLDYLQLYRKFTFTNHESYALNNIAKVELGKQKIDYGEYKNLDNLYAQNPQLFYEYNIEDAFLVSQLEDKLNFIKQVISIAYLAKVNYIDAMVTLRPWDVVIHNYLLEKNIVIPQTNRDHPYKEILGGYVKEPQIGMHKWIVSFDFDSLYPSILSQHNISPETLLSKEETNSPEDIVKYNKWPKRSGEDIFCANGTVFRREIRGFIPDIVDKFRDLRSSIKSKMIELEKQKQNPRYNSYLTGKEIEHLDHYQQALKILNNGLYGALSMRYFRWYDVDLAEAVTYTAQVCTRYVEKELNSYLNKLLGTTDIDYIVEADTDSVYVNLEPLVVKLGMENKPTLEIVEFLDKVCKEKIHPLIRIFCSQLCEKLSVYIPKLHMKREVIVDKMIIRAAKMYVLHIWDKEGIRYKEGQIKTKGIEAVRSSTPMICRDHIKEAIKIILKEDEKFLQRYIEEFKKDFMKMPFETIAFPRTVNGMLEYTSVSSGTPIHVRGALVYNIAIEELGLLKKYQPIKDKDKIRFCYLKKNNPFNSHVISCSDQLPKEFELDDWLDRETQWQKAFLGPVESITNIIGWKTVDIPDLKDFI
jgi:DNA polymerase elongation subunit (family B)